MRNKAVLITVVLALASSGTVWATVASTFDTDTEDWLWGGSPVSWSATGGNPGGYIDVVVAAYGYLSSPAKFLGDLSAYDGGTFSFDAILIDDASGNQAGSYAFGEVTISDGTNSASTDFFPWDQRPGTGSWSSYSHDFTAESFNVTQVVWDDILDNVSGLSIQVNTYQGEEEYGLDNIVLVPEPMTVGLLALGGFALLRRRRG